MAFEFGKGTKIPLEESTFSPGDETSLLRKTGEFLLPQTTAHLDRAKTGEGSTLREGAGVVGEIASFAPLGRAVSGAFRGVRGLLKGEKAADAAQTGARIRRGETIAEGATGGALFEGSQAVADPAAGIDDILKSAGLGAIYGGVAGAVLPPILRTGARVVGGTTNALRKTIGRQGDNELLETTTESLWKSFAEDRAAVLNGLTKISGRFRNTLGEIDERELLKEVAGEGYIPQVRGDTANFRSSIEQNKAKMGTLSQAVTRLAEKFDDANQPPVTLQQFNDAVLDAISKRSDIDIRAAEGQFKRQMQTMKKQYGENLTAKNLDEIRRQSNQKSKVGDTFIADVNSEVGRVSRNFLDDVDQNIRRLNAESQRLRRIGEVLRLMNNKKINTGYWSSGTGRLLATILAGQAGMTSALVGGALAGGGGLVIAGIVAQMGARAIARLIRRSRFNPQIMEQLRAVLKGDQKLLKEVLDEADPKDKAIIQKALGGTAEEIKGGDVNRFIDRVKSGTSLGLATRAVPEDDIKFFSEYAEKLQRGTNSAKDDKIFQATMDAYLMSIPSTKKGKIDFLKAVAGRQEEAAFEQTISN